jgi:PleD family two-component response regulator
MPPGLDGIETTARLLEQDPEVGIVICSAYSDHSWEEMTEAFGTTDRVLILKKPFDTVEVRQLAHALQRRWELARLAALRVEDLTAVIEAQTRELKAANEALKREAALREDALRRLGESHEQIRALAYQDGLTGLPNRRLLNEHLEKMLARARRKSTEFAVLFIDVDNFKLINDTIGPPRRRSRAEAPGGVIERPRSLRRRAQSLPRGRDRPGRHDHDGADRRVRAIATRRRRVHHSVARYA